MISSHPLRPLFRRCEARVKAQTSDLLASGWLVRAGDYSYSGTPISKYSGFPASPKHAPHCAARLPQRTTSGGHRVRRVKT
jgi:hypothetical protein